MSRLHRALVTTICCVTLAVTHIAGPASAKIHRGDWNVVPCDSGTGVTDRCFDGVEFQVDGDDTWYSMADVPLTDVERLDLTSGWSRFSIPVYEEYMPTLKWHDGSSCSEDYQWRFYANPLTLPESTPIVAMRLTMHMAGVDFSQFIAQDAWTTWPAPGHVQVTMPRILTYIPDWDVNIAGNITTGSQSDYGFNISNEPCINGAEGLQVVSNANIQYTAFPVVWGVGRVTSTGDPGMTKDVSKNVMSGIFVRMWGSHYRPDGSVFDDGYLTMRMAPQTLTNAGTSQSEMLANGIETYIETASFAVNYIPHYEMVATPDGGIEIRIWGMHFSKFKANMKANHRGRTQRLKATPKAVAVGKSKSIARKSRQGLTVAWIVQTPDVCRLVGSAKHPKFKGLAVGTCSLKAMNLGNRRYKGLSAVRTITIR